MTPDKTLNDRQAELERQHLGSLAKHMTADDKQHVMAHTQALVERQGMQDDPELLPLVTLDDVPADIKIPQGELRPIGKRPVTWYAQGANGMVYQQLVLDLPPLDQRQLDLLPLYCACLTEVGSSGRDYLATQAHQAAVTGGVSARCLVRGSIDDVQKTRGIMVIAGKALARNHAPLTHLLSETLNTARFDELPRLRELIAQLRASREEGVVDHGHLLAMAAASAGLSPAAALSHRWDGLQGLQTLKTLDEEIAEEIMLADLADQFVQLHELIKVAPCQILSVSDAEQQNPIASALSECWQPYPAPEIHQPALKLDPVVARLQQAWSTSTQVNFCAKVYPTVPQNHPDAAALQVLGECLRNGYLHRAVREQGGAYGAGASYQPDSGAFRFFSYRDPRLEATLADFDAALAWFEETKHPAQVLEEAILGIIASIDRPGSPAGEAISAFFGELFGRTPTQRRTFRQRVLQVTFEDLHRVADAYLQPGQASCAVISNPNTLAKLKGFETQAI